MKSLQSPNLFRVKAKVVSGVKLSHTLRLSPTVLMFHQLRQPKRVIILPLALPSRGFIPAINAARDTLFLGALQRRTQSCFSILGTRGRSNRVPFLLLCANFPRPMDDRLCPCLPRAHAVPSFVIRLSLSASALPFPPRSLLSRARPYFEVQPIHSALSVGIFGFIRGVSLHSPSPRSDRNFQNGTACSLENCQGFR